MKKLQIFGLLGLVMVLAFAMTACNNDDDDDSSSPPVVTMDSLVGYGMINGQVAQVVISETARVVLTPATGQYYVIKYLTSGEIISIGKVEYSAPVITFIPDSGGDSFTGTYSLGGYLFIGVPVSGSIINVLFDYDPSVGTPAPGANTTAEKTLTITGLDQIDPEVVATWIMNIYSKPTMDTSAPTTLIATYTLASTDIYGITNVRFTLKDTVIGGNPPWTGGKGYIELRNAGNSEKLFYTGGKEYVKGSDLKEFVFTGANMTLDIDQFKESPVKMPEFQLPGNISYYPDLYVYGGKLSWSLTAGNNPSGDIMFSITPPTNITDLDGTITYGLFLANMLDPDDPLFNGVPRALTSAGTVTPANLQTTIESVFGVASLTTADVGKVFYIAFTGKMLGTSFPNTKVLSAPADSDEYYSTQYLKITIAP